MEADRLRAIAESHLKTPCEIHGAAEVEDGQGGWTKTPVIKETTRCRITAGGRVSEMAADIAAKLQGREVYGYKLPFASTVCVGDTIQAAGRIFEVLSLSQAPDGTLSLGWCV